jgi:uncharacterized membrane protein YfcA
VAELLTALCAAVGGAIGGLLGVGGGIVFVPALALILDEPQLQASATSLLAIVPVAIVGTWRQHRNGNVEVRDGVAVGLLSIPGVAAGVALANVLPQRALELAFAGLSLFVAFQLLRRALRPAEPGETAAAGTEPERR